MNFSNQYIKSAQLFNASLIGKSGVVEWKSPSNIALVKYWGKYENQIPANPSVSLTLKNSFTQTRVEYSVTDKPKTDFFFEGKINEAFGKRIKGYLESLHNYFPFLNKLALKINSANSFPHSSGIASSASAMSALALCVCNIECELYGLECNTEAFYKKASFMSRLGSGSASRSVYGGGAIWGESKYFLRSSNELASPLYNNMSDVFKTYNDAILIVDAGEKSVSSSVGHGLMLNHPYAAQRYIEAQNNINKVLGILDNGDIDEFINLTENEALTLHAMMMTSNPGYMLMKAGTVEIIHRVRDYRVAEKTNVAFTLDAGANVHLLYPDSESAKNRDFIENELKTFTENGKVIYDEVGEGPNKIE